MLLSRNTTPAERARGCVFSETFETPAAVARNGGVVSGTPPINFGATFNGSTDYITYGAVGSFFVSNSISFVVEFWPETSHDTDSTLYICDASGSRYTMAKANAAGSYVFTIRLGNVLVALVPAATYGAYWKVGERNVIVISGTSGNTNAWLNGNQILTNNAVVWSSGSPGALYVGCDNATNGRFDGRITKFQIYKRLLTAQEAADFYTNETYSYRNETSLNLPFDAAHHDPTNLRALDVSGNARHATFGNGSTPSTYPTKTIDGYSFDGSSDYMTVPGTGVFNAAGCTIAVEFTPDFAFDDGAYRYLFDTSAPRYMMRKESDSSLRLLLGGNTIFDVSGAVYGGYWLKRGKNIIIISSVSGATNVWFNRVLIVGNDVDTYTPGDPAQVFIGVDNTGVGNPFDGTVHSFRVWRQALTPLQVADLS